MSMYFINYDVFNVQCFKNCCIVNVWMCMNMRKVSHSFVAKSILVCNERWLTWLINFHLNIEHTLCQLKLYLLECLVFRLPVRIFYLKSIKNQSSCHQCYTIYWPGGHNELNDAMTVDCRRHIIWNHCELCTIMFFRVY